MFGKNFIDRRKGQDRSAGGAVTVAVCTENDRIDEDIKLFNQALSDGELIGERLNTLLRLSKDMGYGDKGYNKPPEE